MVDRAGLGRHTLGRLGRERSASFIRLSCLAGRVGPTDNADAVSSVQFSSVAPELLVAVGSREGPQDSGSPSLSSTSGDSSSEEGGDSEDEETRRSPVLSSARDGYMRIISFAEEGAV